MQYSPRFIQRLAIQVREETVSDFTIPISYSLFRNMVQVMDTEPTHIICGSDVWSMFRSDATIDSLTIKNSVGPSWLLGQFMNCDVVSDHFMSPENILPKNFCALVALNADPCTWAHECPVVAIKCIKAVLLCR